MIDCTFGGKAVLLSGANEFALEPGVAPSTGQLTMYETDALALQRKNTGHTLKWIDEAGNTLEFKQLYIQRIEGALVANPGAQASGSSGTGGSAPASRSGLGGSMTGGIAGVAGGAGGGAAAGAIAGPSNNNVVTVYIADKRSLWQWPTLTGQFNVLMDDGIAYITNTPKSGQTPWTWEELVTKCWTALGETEPANPRSPSWVPQNIRWEFANAAQALAALLEPQQLDVAVKPDGTFAYLDLRDDAVTRPTDYLGHAVTPRDIAHRTPATVRIAFRVLREKEVTCEAVLKHDAKTGASSDSDATAKDGEWITLAAAGTAWGFTTAELNSAYYTIHKFPEQRNLWLKKLGGGQIGAARLNRLMAQAYRVFRVSDTDRDKILPLVPVRANVQTTTGRAVWMGALPGASITYHWPRHRNNGIASPLAAVAANDYFENFTGRPGFPVHIVDPKEGVVEFQTPDGTPVTGVAKRGTGNMVPFEFALDPSTVKVLIGYFKKFSSTTDPEADYHLVSQTVSGNTNGKTQTFLAPKAFLREVDDGAGGFTKQNQTDLELIANHYLTDYIESFNQPDPEEYHVSGIEKQQHLTGAVRGIRWTLARGDGLKTHLKLFSPHGARPVGQPPRAWAKEFTAQAESATMLADGNWNHGDGAFHFDLGSLDNHAPMLKDHGSMERTEYGSSVAFSGWVDDETGFILIAEDYGMGNGTKKYGQPQTTGGGRGTTSGGTQTTSGGTQITGGGTSKVGG